MATEINKVDWCNISPGLYQAALWVDNFPMPVAFVWYHASDDKIKIIHTFTISFFRRKGLMRHLFKEIVKWYPSLKYVVTDTGTKEGGLAFLKSFGFRQQNTGWVFEVKRPRKAKQKN